MSKLIILSIVIMSFALPIYLSTSAQPAKMLKRVQVLMCLYVLLWSYLCLHWYPILVPLK